MPEVWIPYGSVETLVTIQAENLGELIEPKVNDGAEGHAQQLEGMSGASIVFVGDTKPTTLDFVRKLLAGEAGSEMRLYSHDAKGVEAALPEAKGRLLEPSSERVRTAGGLLIQPQLQAAGQKVFVATAQPDPLFGIVDARVRCAIEFVSEAREGAATARKDYEPTPFERTESYNFVDGLLKDIDVRFATIVPRAGKIGAVLVDRPFDEVRNGFYSCSVSQSRAMIAGIGGSGYDDTLSGALRTVWSVLDGLRKSGELLIVAECSKGLGSRALELLVTGRLGDEGRSRGKYVEGLEEVFYLSKLKQDYDVMLLSGLPEVYARTKLGLSTAKGSAEAVVKLLTKLGRSSKVNVVTRACECRVYSA